ncbi:hypothetical protein PV08_05260 [Exophiala spinifera]|uniref:Fungal N-terminal domain-containing protein n=1 Tax=Exophiala spinifera TaxID=91928 RepID=A0A0D2B978_9EURO|nr:uncharacterized protein PV08_05260 [Exophiala spinifera]KIW15215.1 hypothetical protein PV08_05260 [Exophiala spinifera]
MANDDGLAGTVIGIARSGIKLAVTLHNFSETVTTARIEIKDLANNVALTASVLHELGVKLDQDYDDEEGEHVYSSSAIGTTREATRECEAVFREIETIIGKAMQSARERGVKNGKVPALSPLERLKYPFLLPKVDLLATNLERLKSTLVLMLNVLSYAREMKAEGGNSPQQQQDGYQKLLLENLVRANKDATRRYEAMLKDLGEETESFPAESAPQSRPDSNGSAAASASLSLSMIKTPDSDDSYADSSPRARAASTIQACLDRLENALVKVEQSSSVLHHSTGIVVRVELDRDTPAQQGQPQKPRISVSVLQKQTRPRQDSLQSRTSTSRPRRNTNGLSRSNTWYSNLWNSMPSPYSAMSSIQQTLDNTGLFLATEQITEDASNVLSYNQTSNNGVNGGYQPYSNRYGSSTYANPADNGDESPDSDSGPTLTDAIRAVLPDSLVSGRRPDPASRIGDIEMNPVAVQAQGADASRPLMSADAIEHTPRLGPLPEVRVELDTPSASASASISRPAPAALGSETSNRQANHAAEGSGGGGGGGGGGWSPEQDARMKDILSASVQAAIAQGESEGAKIEPPPPPPTTTMSLASNPDRRSAVSSSDAATATAIDGQKSEETIDEDAMETVDLDDGAQKGPENGKGEGKGKGKAKAPLQLATTTGTGLGVLMGTSDGADAVDQLLGEWTTLRVNSAGTSGGGGSGGAGGS